MNQKLVKIISINLLVHYIMKIKIEFLKMLLSNWSWYMYVHVFILKMLHFIHINVWQCNKFSKFISIFLNILRINILFVSVEFTKIQKCAINQNKYCLIYITNKVYWQIISAINFFVILEQHLRFIFRVLLVTDFCVIVWRLLWDI